MSSKQKRGARRRARRGVSLMEVLISTFVLSFGLLGLAALLPLGRFAVVETNKADYSGACGRAALDDVKIRRMLYPYYINTATGTLSELWVDDGGSGVVDDCFTQGAFAIDPLGIANGRPKTLGNATRALPRVTFAGIAASADPLATAQAMFLWKNDLSFTNPENARTRQNFYDSSNGLTTDPTTAVEPVVEGHYSWLATVTPAASEKNLFLEPPLPPYAARRLYRVSVAVCYRRDFAAEQAVDVMNFVGNIGLGGGTITLASRLNVKPNEWILLCGLDNASTGTLAQAEWYRVISVGEISGNQALTLQGPDWNYDGNNDTTLDATAVVIPTVVGVYSETIEVDNDPLWSF